MKLWKPSRSSRSSPLCWCSTLMYVERFRNYSFYQNNLNYFLFQFRGFPSRRSESVSVTRCAFWLGARWFWSASHFHSQPGDLEPIRFVRQPVDRASIHELWPTRNAGHAAHHPYRRTKRRIPSVFHRTVTNLRAALARLSPLPRGARSAAGQRAVRARRSRTLPEPLSPNRRSSNCGGLECLGRRRRRERQRRRPEQLHERHVRPSRRSASPAPDPTPVPHVCRRQQGAQLRPAAQSAPHSALSEQVLAKRWERLPASGAPPLL